MTRDGRAAELPLFLHWEKFLLWLLPKTGEFPRSVRFTLQQRIDNAALEVLEGILAARYRRDRAGYLHAISLGIDRLQVLLRIAHELGHLDHRGYEHAARQLDEAGRMAGGWLKHAEARR
jgi:hypothetical protein